MEQTCGDDLDERPRHVSRKHHYVPKFLLANFTSEHQHPGKLCYFDNEVGVSRWQSPTGVAREIDFYTVDVPGQPPDLIEGYFAKVENLVAPTIRRIVFDHQMPTGAEYVDLMHFLALMYTRGPAFREMILQGLTAPIEMFMRWSASSPENYEVSLRGMPADKKKPSFDLMQRWAQDEKMVEVSNQSAMHAQAVMNGLHDGTRMLYLRTWTVMVAEDKSSDFICSDKPVSLESTKPRTGWAPQGLIHSDNDFILPIHRKVALLGRLVFREDVYNPPPAQFYDVDRRVVALVNRRTMLGAWRYLYAPAEEFYVLDDRGVEVPGSVHWLSMTPQRVVTLQ